MAKRGRELVKEIKLEQKSTETVNMTFRIPKDLAEKLKHVCEKQGISVNQAVTKMIQHFVSDF